MFLCYLCLCIVRFVVHPLYHCIASGSELRFWDGMLGHKALNQILIKHVKLQLLHTQWNTINFYN